ncbi:uncharacterized protein LOC133818365 [Humulus lupulus]|uniref:uncharacterized protein LOC133818365 n=1 Tax=Humulus lupulus TaxID=3486 RepID=UPI002B412AA5|nr:uncharacterized protein LOC133818365 [Humulus lupulus]
MDIVKDSNNSSKKAMKLLLSLSAISFIFSYSSLLVPFLVNSFTHVYFSAFTKQSSSFTSSPPLDKTYVFLLFNGILVIIVKNSGLIGNTKSSDGVVSANMIGKTTPSSKLSSDSKKPVVEREIIQNQQLIMTEVNRIVVVEEDEELNKIEAEEEEEEYELPSSDEFNKKCEDFIRRVKEEIMSEAR